MCVRRGEQSSYWPRGADGSPRRVRGLVHHARPFVGVLQMSNSKSLRLTSGDKCPQNGSKNAPMAPRPHLGCSHEGSRVARVLRGSVFYERGTLLKRFRVFPRRMSEAPLDDVQH